MCGAIVFASGERQEKKNTKINYDASWAKYNFVASGGGVAVVTLLLSRIHNKLISRRASHENIRKVFCTCVRNSRWLREGVGRAREQRAGRRV